MMFKMGQGMMRYAVCVAMGILSGAFLNRACGQSPQTLKAFQTQPHVGPVEQALVGVEVNTSGNGGAKEARRGNGVVIRCDGFVLAPAALFASGLGNARQQIWVALHPGTEQEKRVPASIVAYPGQNRRTWVGKPEAYAVLKLSDVHVPALRLLLPDGIGDETQVTLAWSAWDDQKFRFLPVQKQPVALANLGRKHNAGASRLEFGQSQTVPMSGAVVVGPDGMGVGLLTARSSASGSASEFATFTTLNTLVNCITPQSLPDSRLPASGRAENLNGVEAGENEMEGKNSTPSRNAQAGAKSDGKPSAYSKMVAVEGGPVRLNGFLKLYQRDMQEAGTACVAPFQIDRYEVTNREYRQFWESLDASERQKHKAEYYPITWASEALPFPPEVENVPVLGVHLAGAQAYATWAGKRLPTPYEWCLAAFGPNGGTQMPDWVQRYVADRQATWNQITTAHYQYTLQNPDVTQTGSDGTVRLAAQSILPWLFWYPFEARHSTWSHDTVMKLTAHLWKDWNDPQHVLPVGSRKFDVSPYGVRDMIFNGAEMVMPGRLWPDADGGKSADYYIQIGFPDMPHEDVAKLGPLQQYGPRAVHLEVSPIFAILPEPLASRRLRGPVTLGTTDAGIYADYMNLCANLREVSDMMHPIAGGVVGIAPGPTRVWLDFAYQTLPFREEEASELRQRYGRDFAADANQKVRTLFRDTAWYALWKNQTLPTHRETGLDVDTLPLAAPPLNATQDPTLATFLVPGGFRCVR